MCKGVFPAWMPVYYVSKEAKRGCWDHETGVTYSCKPLNTALNTDPLQE